MSSLASRRLLFVAALFLLPFPILLLGPGSVPSMRFLMLAGIGFVFALAERPEGMALLLPGVLAAQGLVYAGIAWLVAWAVARPLASLAAHTRLRLTLLLVMVATGIAFSQPVYETPFSATSAHSNLVGVYR